MRLSKSSAILTIFGILYLKTLNAESYGTSQTSNSTSWNSRNPGIHQAKGIYEDVYAKKTPTENAVVGTGKTWLSGGGGFKIKEFIFYISAAGLFVSFGIIILTAPLQRRSLQARSLSPNQQAKMMEIFEGRGILDSDNCVEKIACQLGDNVRRSGMGNWGQRFVDSIPQNNRVVKRFARAYNLDDCYSFRCEPLTFMAKLLIYVVDFNTVLKTIL